jgi:hypothetical protein
MKDIVFIIPINHSSNITPLRKLLRDNTIHSLNNQTSDNWEALLIGEYDKTEGNIRYIPAVSSDPAYEKKFRGDPGHTDKHFKIDVAMEFIAKEQRKPKYVIRLDDDDLISPNIVSTIEKIGDNYDCFADRYQVLYNITNGKLSFNDFPWMANTVFHKYEHAKVFITARGNTLINCSHEAFHEYYAGKKVWYAPKMHPIYVRTHSPTVLNLHSKSGAISYEQHLKRYRFWHYSLLPEYEPYFAKLAVDYENLTRNKIIRNYTTFNYIKSFCSYEYERWFSNFFPRLGNKIKRLTGHAAIV